MKTRQAGVKVRTGIQARVITMCGVPDIRVTMLEEWNKIASLSAWNTAWQPPKLKMIQDIPWI